MFMIREREKKKKTYASSSSEYHQPLCPQGVHGQSRRGSREFPRGESSAGWRVRGFHYYSADGPNMEGGDRGFDHPAVPVMNSAKSLRTYFVCDYDARPEPEHQRAAG